MRHVLVDHARAHAREKRGGGAQRVALQENEIIAEEKNPDLLALDRALTTLGRWMRKARSRNCATSPASQLRRLRR